MFDRNGDSPRPGWFAVSEDGSHVIGPFAVKGAAEAALAVNQRYRLAYGVREGGQLVETPAPH